MVTFRLHGGLAFCLVILLLLGGPSIAQLPKPVRVIDSPGATYCVDVSHDGKLVAAGGDNCKVFVWDAQTGKRLFELDESKRKVASLRFTNGGKRIACCGYGLTLHRMKDGAEIARDELFGRVAVDRLLYAREGKWLLGWKAGGVMVFDGETLKKRRTEAFVYNKRGGFALSGDGKLLATVGEDDDEVKLWRVDLWK